MCVAHLYSLKCLSVSVHKRLSCAGRPPWWLTWAERQVARPAQGSPIATPSKSAELAPNATPPFFLSPVSPEREESAKKIPPFLIHNQSTSQLCAYSCRGCVMSQGRNALPGFCFVMVKVGRRSELGYVCVRPKYTASRQPSWLPHRVHLFLLEDGPFCHNSWHKALNRHEQANQFLCVPCSLLLVYFIRVQAGLE